MKTAAIQMASGPDKERNIQRALSLVQEALGKKAAFVCLPEYFTFRGKLTTREDVARVAEKVNGPTTIAFAALARKTRAHILLGSVYESAGIKGRVFNTSILIGPDGKIKAAYRKNHLFHVCFKGQEVREAGLLTPGIKRAVVRVGPFTLGMCLCFDVRFPSFFGAYARRGVDLFTLPSAFTRATGRAHWEVLVRARAVDTFSYVVAPAQAGAQADGVSCWGQSMIVDPWGRLLAQASQDQEEVIYADLDPEEPRRRRRTFPGIKNFK